jgi:DNA repair exonuclease SbcCD ATPase subunit
MVVESKAVLDEAYYYQTLDKLLDLVKKATPIENLQFKEVKKSWEVHQRLLGEIQQTEEQLDQRDQEIQREIEKQEEVDKLKDDCTKLVGDIKDQIDQLETKVDKLDIEMNIQKALSVATHEANTLESEAQDLMQQKQKLETDIDRLNLQKLQSQWENAKRYWPNYTREIDRFW